MNCLTPAVCLRAEGRDKFDVCVQSKTDKLTMVAVRNKIAGIGLAQGPLVKMSLTAINPLDKLILNHR